MVTPTSKRSLFCTCVLCWPSESICSALNLPALLLCKGPRMIKKRVSLDSASDLTVHLRLIFFSKHRLLECIPINSPCNIVEPRIEYLTYYVIQNSSHAFSIDVIEFFD
ncbi:hypothetical protein KIN20_002328 [Parelaphostrongylus tenuis]|uniref:Uncharacterized protein n=1 Tax=Parelaphostrongylus tenuis TaxID=148309 RepID=A0AAD5ME16_PARTN|nr:hypothetical protein KIN20_002328 [Parelaphostrongylus tenuis]